MRLTAIIAAVCLAVGACDSRPATQQQRRAAAKRPTTMIARGSATISGEVKVVGWRGVPTSLPCKCGDKHTTVPDETVVVNPNGTLRNVVVYVKDSPPCAAAPGPDPVLDQVNCRYTPHVLAMHVGQKLRVRSSDPTYHNVHMLTSVNPEVNFGMPQPGEEVLSFAGSEFIRVKCDVHPWMLAYVAVFDHPFFAVTGDDGTFRIEGVPAGAWTLAAWHERFGELEQRVEVAEGASIGASFTFSPPGR